MKKFFTDILTGIDNKTFDIGRVGIGVILIFFIIFEAVEVIVTHNFNELEFAGAAIAILTGGAGGLALKSKTEPPGGKENVKSS